MSEELTDIIVGSGVAAHAFLWTYARNLQNNNLDLPRRIVWIKSPVLPTCSLTSTSIVSKAGLQRNTSPFGDQLIDSYELFNNHFKDFDSVEVAAQTHLLHGDPEQFNKRYSDAPSTCLIVQSKHFLKELEEEFLQVYTPSFMSSASETGADVFEVQYFEKKAYLAQSPQFYKQMAIASGLERVFINGPVFRAEQSFTTRHMTEFTGWDFEISLVESHHDVMDMEEQMIISAFEQLKKDIPELEVSIPTAPFPRIPIKEVKEKLKAAGIQSGEEHDLSPEEERGICKLVKEETGSDFVFITDYHISKRPFYHMRHEDNPELTKSADLLYKGLEITTLAQREHRPEILKAQAIEKKMDLDELSDYMNFFRYGCPPHGGGGIGPSRLIMRLLELDSVKEATFLPRDVNRLTP